jgi:hypothetical protein
MENVEPQAEVDKKTRNPKGGRKGWATTEQEKWLRERIPAYHTAQATGARGLAEFWPPLWEGWFSTWPEPAEAESAEASSSKPDDSDQRCEAAQARKLVSFTIHIFESMLTSSSSVSSSGLTIIHVLRREARSRASKSLI